VRPFITVSRERKRGEFPGLILNALKTLLPITSDSFAPVIFKNPDETAETVYMGESGINMRLGKEDASNIFLKQLLFVITGIKKLWRLFLN
jgi:hypothetical protein